MNDRHKVFVSYYHDEDQQYKDKFRYLFEDLYDVTVSRSVEIGDIDPNSNTEYIRQKIRDEYLRESTVTVVLVGAHTWQRKHVDWEIYSSLRETQYNPRSGLLGIILPTYTDYDKQSNTCNPCTIPPRLYDNLEKRNDGSPPFASIYLWSESPQHVQKWIQEAFEKRNKINPINNRKLYINNHRGNHWCD
ncbi:MAG: TIR domain-containing protein [Candidatus Thermoplasmatota archaeon]|nr:TIR domain-containing protein [Candidatus Thermoplasmatota archaeon]